MSIRDTKDAIREGKKLIDHYDGYDPDKDQHRDAWEGPVWLSVLAWLGIGGFALFGACVAIVWALR